MLTNLKIIRFKRFKEVDIPLGSAVVLIGPNNSGKTAVLQALALWDVGVKRWVEKKGSGKRVPQKRPAVTINRRDIIAIPMPDANHLWQGLHVRDVQRVQGKPQTQNVRIDIVVEGITEGKSWQCGMEFDYANAESIYCRPLRLSENKSPERMPVPREATLVELAFLPPMSGLAANETKLDPGAIKVRIGEGRTAEVLRNLCYRLVEDQSKRAHWEKLKSHIRSLFGVEIMEPEYVAERGEIAMSYRDLSGIQLDLSSSGRGLQQTLLLLAYLFDSPGSVLLLDEPDAHLEIFRQRQIYNLITDIARQQGGQVMAASHSEVVLAEAAGKDIVVAFVGKPHRIDDRGSQVLKALSDIGYDQYYQAEQKGWVLYLEGSTDLSILKTFAQTLNHPAAKYLEQPFVHYVGDQPKQAERHFYGLREAHSKLVGVALFDRLHRDLPPTMTDTSPLCGMTWQRREIENYVLNTQVLLAYAEAIDGMDFPGPLWSAAEREKRRRVMDSCIADLVPPVALRDVNDRYWRDVKASDELLDRLFDMYFFRLELPNLMLKTNYYQLARYVPADLIDPEIVAKLDRIVEIARSAAPVRNES